MILLRMRWHYLGHAMWLLEFGGEGVRVLFDPLLSDAHDDGLSSVVPRRELLSERLHADFIVVSHRHPDHFDVGSLAWLATRDSQTVVLTADAFVAQTCRDLGFQQVNVLSDWERVELIDGTLLTTPSYGSSLEWGVAVICDDGVVWNHVDSVLGSGAQLERTLQVLRGAAGQGVDLHLARWCPVLEVAPQLAGHIGFPRGTYAQLLEQLSLLGRDRPTSLAPAAVSVAPRPPFDALAPNAFPVTPRQFRRDLAMLAPSIRQLELAVGDVLVVHEGRVTRLEGGSPLVRAIGDATLPTFVPFEVRPLTDPHSSAEECQGCADPTALIRSWFENRLTPRLRQLSAAAAPSELPLVLCLELRTGAEPCGSADSDYSGPRQGERAGAWTLRLDARGYEISRALDPDYDQLVAVAQGGLSRVLSGRSSWGELLLSGQLRCSDRAFRVCDGALERIAWLPPLFVYASPEYEESFEAATRRRVAGALKARTGRD